MTERTCGILLESIEVSARETGDKAAMVFADRTFTYTQLKQLVSAFALQFSAMGVQPGSTIRTETDDELIVVVTLLASVLLRCRLSLDYGSDTIDYHVDLLIKNGRTAKTIVISDSFSPSNLNSSELTCIWQRGLEQPTGGVLLEVPSDVRGSHETIEITREEQLSGLQANHGAGDGVAVIWPSQSWGFAKTVIGSLLAGQTLYLGWDWKAGIPEEVDQVCASSEVLPIIASVAKGQTFEGGIITDAASATQWEAIEGLEAFKRVFSLIDLPDTGVLYEEERDPAALSRRIAFSLRSSDSLDIEVLTSGHLSVKCGEVQSIRDIGLLAKLGDDGGIDLISPSNAAFPMGQLVDLSRLDAIFSNVKGIKEAVIFQNPKEGEEELIGLAVFEPDTNRYQAFALGCALCRQNYGEFAVPTKLRPIDRIPRGEDGSPLRNVCAALIAEASRLTS